jgi:CelD/BcsL family acetyltransferase involved in cellulose biosynthesis
MVLPLLGEVSMKRAEGELIRGRNGNSAYELLPQAASKQGQPRLLACVLRGNADIISAIADDWRSLCSGGPCDQPFFRPEWVNAYLRAFAPAGTLLLITIREEGRLRAVLPLLEEKSRFLGVPFSRIRSAAHPDYSCRFDIIRDGGRGEDEVLAEIWKCLRALPNWDVIELANIPAGGAAERLLELARAERYRVWQRQVALSPYIVLTPPARDSDFTRFVRSANLRSKLRRRRRKLQELGPVLLRRVDHADAEVLSRFYALERSGWKGKSGTAIDCLPEVKLFYDLVAADATRFGYFSLYALEVSGKTIAAHFGLTLAGRYFPLKVAYDERYGAYSPGHLLVGLVAQEAAERGLFECECLGDSEEWKMQWLAEVRPHATCYIYRNGPLGNLLHLQTSAKHQFRTMVRRVGKPLVAAVRARLSP